MIPRQTAEAFEALAKRLRGVYSCRVEMEPGSPVPARVHITADISRRTAAARDVQSAFFAAMSVMVPLERFAVSSLRRPEGEPAPGADRLRLAGIRYEQDSSGLRVIVSLSQGNQEATGLAEAGLGEDPLRASAEAALAAVAIARAWPEVANLEDVALLAAGTHPVVLVRVRVALLHGKSDLRLGAVLVRGDPREAAVRAALDAVNRLDPERPLLAVTGETA
ncbi:MAG TPA: hypothetical protein VNM16_00445 [Bacillota bacterium]|nr:hypothetical protein [Bacillota bacterium]